MTQRGVLATGSNDGTVRVFEVGRPAALLVLEPLGGRAVTCLRWSPQWASMVGIGCGTELVELVELAAMSVLSVLSVLSVQCWQRCWCSVVGAVLSALLVQRCQCCRRCSVVGAALSVLSVLLQCCRPRHTHATPTPYPHHIRAEDGVLHVFDLAASPHDAAHRLELGSVQEFAFLSTQPRLIVVACDSETKLVALPAWLGAQMDC